MSPRSLRLVAAAVATLAAAIALPAIAASPAAAYPSDRVELAGHGWGHGRGMGQYGALGYAVEHGWQHEQILGHYYGGTTHGDLEGGDNYGMTVRIMDRNNADTILAGPLSIDGVGGPFGAAIIRRQPGGTGWDIFANGGGCTGPWPSSPTHTASAPTVRARAEAGHLLTICLSTAERQVRGTVRADVISGAQATINEVAMGDYLKGVVPRESPASWGNLGSGKGMEALKAQAVAARSYAAAEDRYPGIAKTCDTTACQVYWGVKQTNAGGSSAGEEPNTNAAVDATAGKVRRHNSNNAVARTEFSSSTGGWTAGGTFPAVQDLGDSISLNPNHNWTQSIPVANIEAKYGRGTLAAIHILSRNGLGAEGGRVRSMRLSFSGGDVEVSGDAFRSAFNLKSDWFTVTNSGAFPYHVVTRDGGVFSFNGARFHGSLPGIGVKTPVKDITEGPPGMGYWLLGEDGGVFSFDVPFYGSMGGQRLNRPVAGMEATPTREGYWLVAGDGGIFSFGDAAFHGSTGSMRLNAPVVGMYPTPTGGGYWMVATDGGIFSFGDAAFHGSTGNLRLNQPVFAMAATPSGNGYWLVARDGGIFTFGDAAFLGSLPGKGVRETAVEVLPSPSGQGYLIVTAEGRVYGFGDAPSAGGPKDVGAGPALAVGAGRVPT